MLVAFACLFPMVTLSKKLKISPPVLIVIGSVFFSVRLAVLALTEFFHPLFYIRESPARHHNSADGDQRSTSMTNVRLDYSRNRSGHSVHNRATFRHKLSQQSRRRIGGLAGHGSGVSDREIRAPG